MIIKREERWHEELDRQYDSRLEDELVQKVWTNK